MSRGGQVTKCSRKIAENVNRLSRVHEHYRQTTDGWTTAYSERERLLKKFANLPKTIQSLHKIAYESLVL